MKKTDINLFTALDTGRFERRMSVGSGLGILLVLLLSVLLNVYLYQFFSGEMQRLESRNNAISLSLQTPEATASIKTYNDLLSKVKLYNNYLITNETVWEGLQNAPHFTKEFMDQVDAYRPESVTYLGLSFDGKMLHIQCRTNDNFPPADFVRSLDESGLFSAVTYGGFTSSMEETGTGYAFTIVCTIGEVNK